MSGTNEQQQGETPIVGYAVHLGPSWVAIVQHDGSIILQHLGKVVFCDSGEVLNLTDLSVLRPEAHEILQECDPNKLAVRTLKLLDDGSVVSDPNAISPKGELTVEQYQVISPTIISAHKFFSRKTGRTSW